MSRENFKIIITVVVIIIAFIIGYFFSGNILHKPLNDNQFRQCEQVARDVYEQKENVIVEAPEGFCVDMTTTTITVGYDNSLRHGQIIAKLKNGKLVMTRDMETVDAVTLNVLMGIVFLAIAVVIILVLKTKKQKK